MAVELIADEGHFFFEGGDYRGGVAFTASDAADVGGIDAEFHSHTIIDTAENSDGWNSITICGTLVTFHVSPCTKTVALRAMSSLT